MSKPEWKPFVEFNSWGWVAGVQRKRWWGRQWKYARRWNNDGSWTFSKNPAYLGCGPRERAENMARQAAEKANDDRARSNRERYEVE